MLLCRVGLIKGYKCRSLVVPFQVFLVFTLIDSRWFPGLHRTGHCQPPDLAGTELQRSVQVLETEAYQLRQDQALWPDDLGSRLRIDPIACGIECNALRGRLASRV
jgi:hypothetical protein